MRMWFKPVKVPGEYPQLQRFPRFSRFLAASLLLLLVAFTIPATPLLILLACTGFGDVDVEHLFKELVEMAVVVVSPWEFPDGH